MVELSPNSGDPDKMPHSAVTDLCLHGLLVTRLGVSSLQWVKTTIFSIALEKEPFFFPNQKVILP